MRSSSARAFRRLGGEGIDRKGVKVLYRARAIVTPED